MTLNREPAFLEGFLLAEEEGQPEGLEDEGEGISRRSFMKYAAVGGVAAAAVGVTAWGGLTQNWFTPAKVPMQWWGIGTTTPEMGFSGETFSGALGDTVVFTEAPWDPTQLSNKMCSDGKDQFDFITNAGTMHEPLFDCGGIVDFDPETALPGWSRVYSQLRTNNPTISIAETGQIVGIPIIQNGDSVAMDLDEIWGDGTPNSGGDAPGTGGDSYGLLFDDQWNGLTAVEKFWACPIYKVANYLERNNLQTISNLETLENADITKVKTFMLDQKSGGQFKTFWSGWSTAVQLLANKEVVALDTWEPVVFAVRALAQDPINAYYMAPSEGYYLWNIPVYMTPHGRDANLDRVLGFGEWTLGGWYGARITTLRGYLTATPDAVSYARDNPDADGGPYDADFIQGRHDKVKAKFNDDVSVYGNQSPANIDKYDAAWSEVTA
ncbi:MAG: twin-arginine translocation signal domain-containing protein [Candidatus Thermoplasmatota archaeon]|nr:twin-arginine translocation signal domain-containing protein [Candidatus Thermoplasmatota archaeon]